MIIHGRIVNSSKAETLLDLQVKNTFITDLNKVYPPWLKQLNIKTYRMKCKLKEEEHGRKK